MNIDFLRTPDAAFENLPNWPYHPNYLEGLPDFGKLRLHYIDEGPKDSDEVFLCLHGQPTWGYLYRKMIPVFRLARVRVIAPDWFGFGRSDKPIHDSTYTFNFHRNTALRLIDSLELRNITLVVQDWGGLIGLTLPHARPDRIKRLLIMNTGLALGHSLGAGFEDWRNYSNAHPDMDIATLMARANPHLSDAEAEAYAAPFPDIHFKAGVRRFPQLVMTEPNMEGVAISKAAQSFLKTEWDGESFMAIGMRDPVLKPRLMYDLCKTINGCPTPMEIELGGHFTQEWGEEIALTALKSWDLL